MDLEEIRKEIELIKERNKRVEGWGMEHNYNKF